MLEWMEDLIAKWNSFCVTIWGYKKLLLAIFLGALSVLALPPINLFFILFITIPSLIWLLDGDTESELDLTLETTNSLFVAGFRNIIRVKGFFYTGFSFAFGYFLFGTYWIGEAFLVNAEDHWFLMPFAILILPAILSIFWGLAAMTAGLFWRHGYFNSILFAISLTFFEFLRGTLFTGFPWNLLGFSFDFSTEMLQTASIWGIYGLTFIAILCSAILSNVTKAEKLYLKPIMIVVVVYGALFGYGSYRLSENETKFHPNVSLRLVQPNIAQKDKWRKDMRGLIANRFIELSNSNTDDQDFGLSDITHLIWPESALPFLLRPESSFMREATRFLPTQSHLITGAVRKQKIDGVDHYYNSILAFDSDGNRVGVYDKTHLVPFGEYLPFSNFLSSLGLEKIVAMKEDFDRGSKIHNMYLKDTPVIGTNICYEIIFTGLVVEREQRPEWILNVTNDAWFGESIGPYQHLAQARMRAVEEGLPLVRVANTGITIVVDPMGRTVSALPRGKAMVLDSPLPRALKSTPYSQSLAFLSRIF